MVKYAILLLFLGVTVLADTGFNIPNVLVSETDGDPRRRPIQELEFSNGTVTVTGTKAAITNSGGGSLSPGSTNYIQNTLTPTTATQVFSVQSGSFSVAGIGMVDSAGCKWTTTIATTGALVTTLVSCPGATTGQCMGLLCSITYAN